MKNLIRAVLVVVVLAVGTNYVSAQQIQFGVKGGIDLTSFTGDVDDLKAKVGFVGGVTVDYNFSGDMYLQSGLLYVMKGATTKEVAGAKFKWNPSYLQLPVHFAYKLPLFDGMKMVFHGGPYVAYGIGGSEKLTGSALAFDHDFFGDKYYKSFDWGLGGGVGVELGKIGVDLSYDHGLHNFSRESDVKARNMAAYLTLGYRF